MVSRSSLSSSVLRVPLSPKKEKNQCSWFLRWDLISSEEMALLPVMMISDSLTLSPSSMVENDVPVASPHLGYDRNHDRIIVSFILIFEPDLFGVFLDELQIKGGPRQQRHAFFQFSSGQFIVAFKGNFPDKRLFLDRENDL